MKVSQIAIALVGGLPGIACDAGAILAVADAALAGLSETGKRAFLVSTGEPENCRFVRLQENPEHLADCGAVSEVALARVKCTEIADQGGGE